MCRECSQCLGHTGFAPAHSVCAFPDYTAQAPGCSAGELSKAGPGLHALPRSMPLRFRFLGTPQKHRFSWACIPCPSQVWAAQATRCLANSLSPGAVCLITSLVQPLGFLGAQQERRLRCAMCFFWRADHSFVLWVGQQCFRLELFTGKFSLSLSLFFFFFFNLSGYPTVWVAISH